MEPGVSIPQSGLSNMISIITGVNLCHYSNKNVSLLRRNCLLHGAIGGQLMEVKGVERTRTQLLDDLRNRRRYWELNEISGLQLPREPHRSTRILQLTGRW